MRRLEVTPSLVISLLALFVALSSGAYAATGGNFILGQANTASSQTSLTGKGGAPALQVTNNSAKLGATALALHTAAGHPPLTTNSTTTAPNLSADLLDGIDSSGFAQGGNTQILTDRKVTVPGGSNMTFAISGFGVIQGTCFSNVASLVFQNTSGGSIDVWTQDTSSGGVQTGTVLANHGTTGINQSGAAAGADSGTGDLGLGVGNDPGPRSVATVHGFAYQSADNAPCGFQVQAIVWHS
jgi:hypothetical protein